MEPIEADGWRIYSMAVDDPRDRECLHCGQCPTEKGHDPCIPCLPGVWSACCGHGRRDLGFVFFGDEDAHGNLRNTGPLVMLDDLDDWSPADEPRQAIARLIERHADLPNRKTWER